jgi:hypothetical protein
LFRLAIDGMGSALFCWLLKANIIATLAIGGAEPSRALEIRNVIHIWMERAFPIAVIGVMVILATDMYRVIRVNKKGAGLSREAVAVLFLLLLTALGQGRQTVRTLRAQTDLLLSNISMPAIGPGP